MNDQNLELCRDKLQNLTHRELREIIHDTVLPYIDKQELLDLIENNFQSCDWEWFLEEYITCNGEMEKDD